MDTKIWICLVLCTLPAVSCWQFCYMCAGLGPRNECEMSPGDFSYGPGVINCTNPYCTTVNVFLRETDDHPFIQTHSMARLCDTVDKGNWCIFDDKFITCYSTCTRSFCNDDIPNPYLLPQRRVESIGVVAGFPKHSQDTISNKINQLAFDDVTSAGIHNAPSDSSSSGNANHNVPGHQENKKQNVLVDGLLKQNAKEKIFDHPKSEKWFLKASERSNGNSVGQSVFSVIFISLCYYLV